MKVGMGQLLVEGGQRADNLNRASHMVEQAKREGCSVIVLPECLDLGWTCEEARALAETFPGETTQFFQGIAQENEIDVIAGITEREGEGIFNTSIWVSSNGRIAGKHRKIHILDIAQHLYTPGRGLSVFDTGFGCSGMTICADNFPENIYLSISLVKMGATLIASPCAWAVDADHDNQADPYGDLWKTAYHQLTTQFDVTIFGVSNVGWISSGPWKGRKCIGCSLAMGPGGRILAEGSYGVDAEELIVVDLG